MWISCFIAQYLLVYKYGKFWSSSARDWSVRNLCFWDDTQKSAYLAEYLNNCWTNFDQRFSFGRGMYADYKNDIGFEVVQGMLLW